MTTLHWTLSDGQQCSEQFNSNIGMMFYLNINKLMEHPDIVEVFSKEDNVKVFYKRKQ